MSGFWNRLFGGKKPAPRVWPTSALETWEAGDKAECVEAGNWIDELAQRVDNGPELGDVLLVQRVYRSRVNPDAWLLNFAPWPGVSFNSVCFRKVQSIPDSEAIELRERIKRFVREPVQ